MITVHVTDTNTTQAWNIEIDHNFEVKQVLEGDAFEGPLVVELEKQLQDGDTYGELGEGVEWCVTRDW